MIIMEFALLFLIGFFIWNRAKQNWIEVTTVDSADRQMKITGILQNAGIRYRWQTGGQDDLPAMTYTLKIHSDDMGKAKKILEEEKLDI